MTSLSYVRGIYHTQSKNMYSISLQKMVNIRDILFGGGNVVWRKSVYYITTLLSQAAYLVKQQVLTCVKIRTQTTLIKAITILGAISDYANQALFPDGAPHHRLTNLPRRFVGDCWSQSNH